MTTYWRIGANELRQVLVLGGLAARARRRLSAELGSLPARPHPIPDLTGQPVDVIADAVITAMVEAHASEAPSDWSPSDGLCQRCLALIELASRYGDPTGKVWPDPVKRRLANLIDAELKRVQG